MQQAGFVVLPAKTFVQAANLLASERIDAMVLSEHQVRSQFLYEAYLLKKQKPETPMIVLTTALSNSTSYPFADYVGQKLDGPDSLLALARTASQPAQYRAGARLYRGAAAWPLADSCLPKCA